jgi:hypothetical protein
MMGERRGGRKQGTPNKITTDVRKAIMQAFAQDPKAVCRSHRCQRDSARRGATG